MNWLAHLHLGGRNRLERLGHLAGDFVRGVPLGGLAAPVRRGVDAHRAIDAFTDAHPVVARSRARLAGEFGRFAGVLVDVLYDHVLAADWSAHAPDAPPLRAFVDEVHADLRTHRDLLPPRLAAIAPRMIAEDWLASYGSVAGVRAILVRMETRLRRPVALAPAADRLGALGPALAADFAAFYPAVRAFAAGR